LAVIIDDDLMEKKYLERRRSFRSRENSPSLRKGTLEVKKCSFVTGFRRSKAEAFKRYDSMVIVAD